MMNRRALLTSTPALALAIATPAAADSVMATTDAELVRLGHLFDLAARDYMANEPRRHATYAVWWSELKRLDIIGGNDPRSESLMKATGYRAAADTAENLTQIMIELHAQMVALPAMTIPSMAAKATVVAWDAGDYGFPGENPGDTLDFRGFWAVVDELRALAGFPSIADLAVQS